MITVEFRNTCDLEDFEHEAADLAASIDLWEKAEELVDHFPHEPGWEREADRRSQETQELIDRIYHGYNGAVIIKIEIGAVLIEPDVNVEGESTEPRNFEFNQTQKGDLTDTA